MMQAAEVGANVVPEIPVKVMAGKRGTRVVFARAGKRLALGSSVLGGKIAAVLAHLGGVERERWAA